MSADSPRRHPSGVGGGGGGVGGGGLRGGGGLAVPAIVPPQTVSDRSILDSAIGFINDVTLANQPVQDPKDTITWARFETCADVSDPRFGDDWELEGNAAPPLLLILGYGLGVQVWAIPANGEAVEVLSWRHGVVTALRVLPTPATAAALDENGRADEPVDAFAEKRPLVALVDGGSAAASGLLAGVGGGSGIGGGSGGGISSGSGGSASGMAQFSAVNFLSLKTGVQVKTIKFKNAVLDIQANRSAVVITFHERIAVFDARTLEDRLTITTCYPSPGINPNPIALGPRWLAYAEHKLLHSKRSGGGCDGEGVPSYTATVLNAAKSLGKGLRELGEQVAAGLTGATAGSGASSKSSSFDSASGGPDAKQSGVVTIIDVKHPVKDYSPTTGTPLSSTGGAQAGGDPIVAHFVAHSEALVAMEFDSSGMLLLTADRRGHDFHVFRVQPHPVGPCLAAVHHLYVLHRGDTSAKVQHIAFSLDSRWASVSTLRGTTHVFPITPYGGAMGARTHTSLHVVNKLSRFHRSAGLGADGRSSSPISHSESTTFVQSLQPYHNPTLPPYPRPSVVQPLAQLRQPFTLGSPPGSAGGLGGVVGVGAGVGGGIGVGSHGGGIGGGIGGGNSSQRQRQRLSSLSDDSGKPLSVCSIFAKSRSWLLEPLTTTREAPHRVQRKAVDSLFVMAGHGALIQYDLDTKLPSNVAKEKICDDTPIELEVEARAQWNLGRRKDGSHEIVPPLALDNWLIKDRHCSLLLDSAHQFDEPDERAESWLAQVEIITHAGPHRRLWMGPQFVFKNYNTPSGSNLNHVDAEAVEIGVTKTTTTTLPSTAAASSTGAGVATGVAAKERSSPLNMPLSAAASLAAASGVGSTAGRTGPGVPVLIESGSYSSIEQSPKLMDRFRHGHLDSDYGHGDTRLKEDLADAMRESPSMAATRRETGQPSGCSASASVAAASSSVSASDNVCYYDALAEHEHLNEPDPDADVDGGGEAPDDEAALAAPEARAQAKVERRHLIEHMRLGSDGSPGSSSSSSMAALASVLPNICSYDYPTGGHHYSGGHSRIEKIVNPLGTVTDVNAGISGELQTDMLDEVVCQLAAEESVIHENCDEALFRPVVAIFCNDLVEQRNHQQQLLLAKEEQAAAAAGLGLGSKGGENDHCKPPVVLANKLIVPVIAKEVDEVLVQKEKQKSQRSQHQKAQQQKSQLRSLAAAEDAAQAQRFAELSHLNKPKGGANPSPSNNSNNSKTASSQRSATEEAAEKEEEKEASGGKASKKSKPARQKMILNNSSTSSTSTSKGADKKLPSVEAEAKEKLKKQSKELQPQNRLQDLDEIVVVMEEDGEESEPEAESDHADSLLANKSSIAAVMVSSASAQGLSLLVETTTQTGEDDTEEEEEAEDDDDVEEEEEEEKKPETMTIEKERLKEKEKLPGKEKLKLEKEKEKLREKEIIQEKQKQKEKEKLKLEKEKQLQEREREKEKEKEKEKLKLEREKQKLEKERLQEKEKLKLEKEKQLQEKERLKLEKEKEKQLQEKEREREREREREKLKLEKEKLEQEKLQAKEREKEKEKEKEKLRLEKEKLQEKEKLKEKEKQLQEKLKLEKEKEKLLEKTKEKEKIPSQEKGKGKAAEISPPTASYWVKVIEEPAPSKKPTAASTVATAVAQSSPTPSPSPWKRVGVVGDDSAAKQDYPTLGKKLSKPSSPEKLASAPEPSPFAKPRAAKENFEDFLSGMEALPPLPDLEPLEVKASEPPHLSPEGGTPLSLINFESPLQESATDMPIKITPPPRGFTEKNLVLALCGSLHYEDEQDRQRDRLRDRQLEEPKVELELKSHPYVLLMAGEDQQHTSLGTQKSTSTSNNSSGSEEIILMEEPTSKKLSKKHKRMKQLQLQQQQQQREKEREREREREKERAREREPEPEDEELRPLISISMCDSQLESHSPIKVAKASRTEEPADADDDDDEEEAEAEAEAEGEDEEEEELSQTLPEDLLHFGSSGVATSGTTATTNTATTTDSEGPIPATTSDDNLVYSSSAAASPPHKLKTKKLEHKINLIAAIEAATSSSTSSAEESSVETAGPIGSGPHADASPSPGTATATSAPNSGGASASSAIPATASSSSVVGLHVGSTVGMGVASQASATKKKTKRRKR
ncbi:uncharacterized protein LOC108152864 isoform X1 [Drosophila miranda]|uniref:uncharacterized protein LOC108152864 isoform X1 n=1 Tax=Drosophila miranda TaxID=7229 RepID=UPI0007E780C3|nr:uncharacterized protein LOC108152864 isoform X1 [Drosophila miranda]XP_017137992.1 uncharacterized protein LOC108152864 isoform X1 [Drosophila miranda]XP_017138000.1 uncharacterized protein LOC108152864 isoform X1 [Drosophila miranda]